MTAPSLSQPYTHDLSTTWKLETERCYAVELCENCLRQIIEMEVSMGIDRQWDPSSPEYLETLGYLSTRTYQCALKELQRLVIQRLFELHKMNISATGEYVPQSGSLTITLRLLGYHMRTHIAKALQNHCKAIRNAVKRYNTAAAQLDPPRPPINWESMSHINFLKEFHLLHNTRQDIREKPWAQPAVRELMKLFQRVKRAHEEIERCHTAVRRLYTAIHDENNDFETTLTRLRTGDTLVYGAVYDFINRRQQVNDLLLARLALLTNSPDYSGDCSHGMRVGGRSADSQEQVFVDGTGTAGSLDHNSNNDEELGEDEMDELVGQLIDYVSDLALLP